MLDLVFEGWSLRLSLFLIFRAKTFRDSCAYILSPLVGSCGLYICPRYVFYRPFSYDYTTDAFLRVFVGFLGFFIWCIGRESAVRSTLHNVLHQLLNRVRTRANLQLLSLTSLRFSFQLSPSLCNFRSSMFSRSRRACRLRADSGSIECRKRTGETE